MLQHVGWRLEIANQTSVNVPPQQCCLNAVHEYNIMQHLKTMQNVARKMCLFSNLIQYHPTCCNSMAERVQHVVLVVLNSVAICCAEMLRDLAGP